MRRGRLMSLVSGAVLLPLLLLLGDLTGTCRAAGYGGLVDGFYSRNCPLAETIVRTVTWARVAADPSLPAEMLRAHFHDCFVRGCDASVLLDSVGSTRSEKEAIPNQSLGGFDLIDMVKEQVEVACPGVVSCADILALVARDAVSARFGLVPLWDVPTGRRDGVVSLASEVTVRQLPSPFSDFDTLKEVFASKGLDVIDLVALSGAHTIGVAHCTSFGKRLYNFTGRGDADPSLDPAYADQLRKLCPDPSDRNTVVPMDPGSAASFDANYFTIVNQNRGLFQSDAALLTNPGAAAATRDLQDSRRFLSQFGKSMRKMGSVGVLTGNQGEIRRRCRVVN